MRHERIEHPQKGPVHIFYPDGYGDAEGVTIFVHGWDLKGRRSPWYADALIEDFSIERKLSKSFTAAPFVVIESRVGRAKPIYWHDLEELLLFLKSSAKMTSDRRVHAIGHSGAYANIAMWLKHEAVEHISLLDSTYGQFDKYASWILGGDEDSPERALDIGVHKGSDTHKGAWNILKRLRDYHTWQKLPERLGGCQTEYLVFPYSHMKWVEQDEILPMVLDRAQRIRNRGLGC